MAALRRGLCYRWSCAVARGALFLLCSGHELEVPWVEARFQSLTMTVMMMVIMMMMMSMLATTMMMIWMQARGARDVDTGATKLP